MSQRTGQGGDASVATEQSKQPVAYAVFVAAAAGCVASAAEVL